MCEEEEYEQRLEGGEGATHKDIMGTASAKALKQGGQCGWNRVREGQERR